MELAWFFSLITLGAIGGTFVWLARTNARLTRENRKLSEELRQERAHFASLVDRITIPTGPKPSGDPERNREEWSVDFENMVADFGKYAELFGRFSYNTRYRLRQNDDSRWEMKAMEEGSAWQPVPEKLVPALEMGRALSNQVRSRRKPV